MSWMIDPNTGDYALEGGVFARDDGLVTPVYLRLCSRRGSYVDDDEWGSRLYELRREKRPETAAQKAPDMVREALQPLLDDGRISDMEVEALPQDHYVAIRVAIVDSDSRPYEFELFQEVR